MKKILHAVLKPVVMLCLLVFIGCGQQPMNNVNQNAQQNGQYFMDGMGRCMSTFGQQVSPNLCQNNNNWNNNNNFNNNQNGQYYQANGQCYQRSNNMQVNPSLCQNNNNNMGGQVCTGIMYMYGYNNQLSQVNCSILTCSGYSLLNAQGQTVFCR